MSEPTPILRQEDLEASPVSVYLVTRDYFGTINGVRYSLFAGAALELRAITARHLNLDQPNTVELLESESSAVEAETRAPDAPPKDRQVKRAPQKRAVTHGE